MKVYKILKQMAIATSKNRIPGFQLEPGMVVEEKALMFYCGISIGRRKDELELVTEYNQMDLWTKERFEKLKSEKEKPDYELDKKFYQPDLLKHIWGELDKVHKLDHYEKIGLFLVSLTAELKDPDDRCSAALKGDSSAGKDSAIKAVLNHFPSEDNFFLTRGTTAALEDEAHRVKRIAFSEINKHRDGGANSEITETFKQLAEGGTNVMKKDPASGYTTTKQITSEQKTLLYGTTETESDDELETRYVVIPIRGYAEKNKVVVDHALDKTADFNYHIKATKVDESWIAKGIRLLNHDVMVIIPYAHLLKSKIKDGDKESYFFDYTKERIKRDAKRLLSITKAITWVHQKQRAIVEKDGLKFILAEPSDFITAVDIFAEFFNLTYSGMDHRLHKCLKKLRELEGKHDAEIMRLQFESKYFSYVLRHKLQEELGIQSLNTIKSRIDKLKDLGYIQDTFYDSSINPQGYLIKAMGVKMGIKRVSLPVTLTALTAYLIAYLTPKTIQNVYQNKKIIPIERDFLKTTCTPAEIDTLKIDTLNSRRDTHDSMPTRLPENPITDTEEDTSITTTTTTTPITPITSIKKVVDVGVKPQPGVFSIESKTDILKVVKARDQGKGCSIQYLINNSKNPKRTEFMIFELKKEGALYENRNGLVRILP